MVDCQTANHCQPDTYDAYKDAREKPILGRHRVSPLKSAASSLSTPDATKVPYDAPVHLKTGVEYEAVLSDVVDQVRGIAGALMK